MKRILIPIAAVLLGVLVAFSFAIKDTPKPPVSPPATPEAPQAPQTPEAPEAPQANAEPSADEMPVEETPHLHAGLESEESTVAPTPTPDTPDTPATPDTPDTPATPIEGLHVLPVGQTADIILGSTDPDSKYMMQVDLVRWGAAYQKITLSNYTERVTDDARYVIATPVKGQRQERYPFAAQRVSINDSESILLEDKAWTLADSDTSFAEYRLVIAGADNRPVLEIVRRYELAEGSYSLDCKQHLINHTDKPIKVVFRQSLQGDIYLTKGGYLGDQRKFVTGYFDPEYDKTKTIVFVDNAFRLRKEVVDNKDIWPNSDVGEGKRLAWLTSENRYFALTTYPTVAATAQSSSDLTYMDQTFARFDVEAFPAADDPALSVSLLSATTPAMTLAPHQTQHLDVSLFAGPRQSDIYAQSPYSLLQFAHLIRYEMGCTWLTFQWLAHGLLGFLTMLDMVTFDWGISIIILVLVVRLILHPITKKAQVNMQKMGKQMQLLKPEMDKIKKKYKDDQTKMNQEVMKLYREKGVNPANMLGCLPMLLQMPIWIALYAMLYFAIELRQEHAFYGVFQFISGGGWHFLQDLSQPDNFIRFVSFGEEGIKLPLYFIEPHFSGINILPLLMAVVFYFQQKFTTPPPANEQAASQQKMMKFMVLLFPVMLYSAPSGLTLYILASTSAGIVDSYFVRKHVKAHEEAGTLFQKKERKPGGFADRMAKRLEEKQKEVEQRQKGNRKYKKR